MGNNEQMNPIPDIDAVLFDFSDVVGRMRMAVAGDPGSGPFHIELIDGMRELIMRLRKASIATGLVTNNDRSAFCERAPDIDLESLFDVVVFSSDVGVAKPGFGIYVHALHALSVDPHRALFLDDIARNVDAAVALGMHGVIVDSPETTFAVVDAVLAGTTQERGQQH